jgi:hypothetical protein
MRVCRMRCLLGIAWKFRLFTITWQLLSVRRWIGMLGWWHLLGVIGIRVAITHRIGRFVFQGRMVCLFAWFLDFRFRRGIAFVKRLGWRLWSLHLWVFTLGMLATCLLGSFKFLRLRGCLGLGIARGCWHCATVNKAFGGVVVSARSVVVTFTLQLRGFRVCVHRCSWLRDGFVIARSLRRRLN